jgi:uncharacterized cupin superfamily protein
MAEARLEHVGTGLTPVTDGWFVVNAREAAWIRHSVFGLRCPFEMQGPVARSREELEPLLFEQFGIHLAVFAPGQPSTLYHAEADNQEDFLVLAGECLAIIDDTERPLKQWDFVHCPPGTAHAFVGAGDRPCVLLMVGAKRTRNVRYFASPVAAAHGAAVERDTDSPTEAYAPTGHWTNDAASPL